MDFFKEKYQQLLATKQWQIMADVFGRINIGVEAAALTYYLLMCLAPILLLVANLIPLLPLPVSAIIQTLQTVLPESISNIVIPLLENYLSQVNGSVISIGAITLLWSASRAFDSLQRTLNTVYDVPQRRNYFFSRLFAFILMVIAIVVVILITMVFVFGRYIVQLLKTFFAIDLQNILTDFTNLRWIVFLTVTLLLVSCIYYIVPNIRWPFLYALPGGILTTVGFGLISQLFTIYVESVGRNWSANGTFGGVLIFMVWLYALTTVIIWGGLLNVFIYRWNQSEGESV